MDPHNEDATLRNNDCCYLCGQGGRMVCCETCPRSYHTGCLASSERSDSKKYEKWSCSYCLSGISEFTLNDMVDSIFIPSASAATHLRAPLSCMDPLGAIDESDEDDNDDDGEGEEEEEEEEEGGGEEESDSNSGNDSSSRKA